MTPEVTISVDSSAVHGHFRLGLRSRAAAFERPSFIWA
jgi:hypothetical protein